jgi:hypothetical protein
MNEFDGRIIDQASYAFRDLTGQRPLGFPFGNGTVYFVTGVPVNAIGINGDIAFRTDGGAGTTMYHRRLGIWVATAA